METPSTQIAATQKALEESVIGAFNTLKGLQSEKNIITANTLTKYSENIQSTLNNFLSKRGVITKQQLDELDEQVREAKKKTLEAQSKNTFVRYGIGLSILVLGFGTIWLITKNKVK